MESQRSSEPSLGPAWVIRRAMEGGADRAELDARMDRLRRDVAAHQTGAVDWEASVLESVANLLDSMGQAHADWESMASRLSDAATDLEEARRERERLEEIETRLSQAQEGLEIARRERDELEGRNRQLEESAGEMERIRARVGELEAAVEAFRSRQQALEVELDDTRQRLEAARRERDVLLEERQARGSVKADLAAARKKIEALEKEGEQSLVLICDLRARVNRIEEERDEALANGRRKVKRILARIHEELDAIGAPAGEELSFGERIRRLKDH